MSLMPARQFDPARMFRPSSLCLSGSQTKLGQELWQNLTQGGFTGTLGRAEHDPLTNADLALVADDAPDVAAALAAHAARGACGAMVLSYMPATSLRRISQDIGIRVLGPHSFGMILPGANLNASPFALTPPQGRVALVGQSSAIARTVIDWAVPNQVGFSHMIGVGRNDATIGFGLVLDHLGRDPGTAAIMVEIDRLRDPPTFFSAIRMAARLRPVIAIAPGSRLNDPTGQAYAAYEAALSRAGALLTGSVGEFLAAAETLTRVKPARQESLVILTNSVSLGRLAADAALQAGLTLATLSPETRQILSLALRQPPPATGPVFAGKQSPTSLADLAAMLSSAPDVGGILVVHAPMGEDDDTAIAALTACAKTVKIPLLIAALGEATGLAHRHRLNAAQLACFDSPEAAIAGFRHLLENRRNRLQARELPAATVLTLQPDHERALALLQAARQHGQDQLIQDKALEVLNTYHIPTLASRHATTPADAAQAATVLGFPAVLKLSHPDLPTNNLAGSVALNLRDEAEVRARADAMCAYVAQQTDAAPHKTAFVVQKQVEQGLILRIRVADNPILGPVISFGEGGGDPAQIAHMAIGLPPLNLALATALIQRAPIASRLRAMRGHAAVNEDAIAATLVRVSQMIIDRPDILTLDIDPLFATPEGVVSASARLQLRPQDAMRPALVIPPYPSALISTYHAKGEAFLLRPIRPEDADAHAAMLSRFSSEDMRFRFFSPLKQLPVEQIVRLADIDYTREMAIIAVHEASQNTVGVARLVRNDTDGTMAEFAVAIDPGFKKYGLGSALMRKIIDWGQSQGVKEIQGQILADNAPMLAFIKRLGFSVQPLPDEPDMKAAKLALPLTSPP